MVFNIATSVRSRHMVDSGALTYIAYVDPCVGANESENRGQARSPPSDFELFPIPTPVCDHGPVTRDGFMGPDPSIYIRLSGEDRLEALSHSDLRRIRDGVPTLLKNSHNSETRSSEKGSREQVSQNYILEKQTSSCRLCGISVVFRTDTNNGGMHDDVQTLLIPASHADCIHD